jgi:hypothetical protein
LLEQDRIDTQAELKQQHRRRNKQVEQSGSQKKIFKSSKTKSGAEHEHSPDQTGGCQTETGSGPSHSGIKAKRRLAKLNLARGSEAKASSKNEVTDSKIKGELALLSGRHSAG